VSTATYGYDWCKLVDTDHFMDELKVTDPAEHYARLCVGVSICPACFAAFQKWMAFHISRKILEKKQSTYVVVIEKAGANYAKDKGGGAVEQPPSVDPRF
jgi:hypothetical protein